jgi:tape measure domain-containing protein
MARIGADIGGLERGLQQAERRIRGFAGSMNSVGTKLSFGLSAPITGLAAAAVRSATQMDSLKRGLTAVAGSSAEAERQLKRLEEIAKLPGLGQIEAIEASTQLQAAGLSAQMAEKSLLAYGNALATVGKGKAELAGVTTALTQITAKGKVTAEEINQIAERVPQIRVAMQAAFGTANTEALQKMGLTAKQFIQGVNDELLKLPRVTGGAQNAFENLEDTTRKAFIAIGNNILPTLLPMVERVTRGLTDMTAKFAALSPEARRAILVIGGLAALAGPTILFLGQLKAAATALGLSMPAVATAIRGVIALLTGPWGLAIAAAITAIALLKTAWDNDIGGMRTTIENWFGYVAPLMQEGWKGIVEGAQVWWAGLKEAWGNLWDSMANNFGGFIKWVLEKLAQLPAALGLDIEKLKRMIELWSVGRAGQMAIDRGPVGPDPTQPAPKAGGSTWKPTIVDDERKKALKRREEELALNARLASHLKNQLGPAVEGLANAQLKNFEAHRLFPDVLRETITDLSALGDEELKGLARSRLELKVLNEGLEARRAIAKEVEAAQVRAKEAAGRGAGLATGKQYKGWLLPDESEGLAGIIAGGERAGRLQDLLKHVHDLRQESARLGFAMQRDTGEGATAAGIAWDKLRLKMQDLSKEERAAVNRAFDYTQTIRIQTQEVERLRQETARWEQAHLDIPEALRNVRTELSVFTDGSKEAAFAWQHFGQQFKDLLPAAQDQVRELVKLDETMKLLQTAADGVKQIFFDAFQSVQDGFSGFFETIYSGVKNLLVQIASEILTSAAYELMRGLVKNLLGDWVGTGTVVSKRQQGGPVSAGRPYLVGERGPEVIMPRRSGHVVPNHQLAGAGGANVTVNFNISAVDADSFRRNQKQLMADALAEAQRAQRRNG